MGGLTIEVSPWRARRAVWQPCRGGTRGGGGARPVQAKEEEGEGAQPGRPARGPDGQWVRERIKIEINFEFDFLF
jgi:hypothetical protein